jgi:hypothetical protein
LWLPACASVGALQPAHTLGRDQVQIGLELSEQAVVSGDVLKAWPMMGVSARYGLFEWMDVGIRFGPSGFEGQVKVQLTARREGAWVVSLAPLAGLSFIDNQGFSLRFYNFALPVLIGIPLAGGHQLIIAPRLHDHAYYVGAGSVGGMINNFGLGLSAGVMLRVWRLMVIPELGVLQPLLITASRETPELSGTQWRAPQTTLQLNLSVLWGSST